MSTTIRPTPVGEPAPWFVSESLTNPLYHFSSVAGRHVVVLFVGSLSAPLPAALWSALAQQRQLFDDLRCSLFIVTTDKLDVESGRAQDHIPGIRVLCDYDMKITFLFGVKTQLPDATISIAPSAVLLDPTLQVMRWFIASNSQPDFTPELLGAVAQLPHPLSGSAQTQAPVIIVPRVFEPDFCRTLIAYYDSRGGKDSGFMRKEADGIRGVIDYSTKRRMDCLIEDEALRKAVALRITRRLKPEISRVFRFDATRMERYLVACYDAETGGHFKPHRDNDGEGHRQFAVTINLNSEEYEGGDLQFPEYGRLHYRAPAGGACVFSCGLMHEALPVTSGQRYAFLPFLYDEASADKREANNARYPDPSHHYFKGAAK